MEIWPFFAIHTQRTHARAANAIRTSANRAAAAQSVRSVRLHTLKFIRIVFKIPRTRFRPPRLLPFAAEEACTGLALLLLEVMSCYRK